MTVYTYRMFDLLTGAPLGEWPMRVGSFSRSINEAGELDATLFLSDRTHVKGWNPETIERRTCLYVIRDTVPVWGGIIWRAKPVDGATKANIYAQTFESYLDHRLIRETVRFNGVDQLDIARALLTAAQTDPRGNIGLTASVNTSGVLRDQTYEGWDRRGVLAALQELAELGDGFEFTVDVGLDADGEPTRTMVLGYPQLGQARGLVLEYPGSIVDYDWPTDGMGAANVASALGSGDGASMLIRDAVSQRATDELAAGYPILETTFSHKDVTTLSRLQAHADEDLDAAVGDVTIPALTVRDTFPVFGTYALGDTTRVRITSPYHPAKTDGAPGVDRSARIVGWRVTPPDGDKPERVELTMGRVPYGEGI
jgi:hypothetical protein